MDADRAARIAYRPRQRDSGICDGNRPADRRGPPRIRFRTHTHIGRNRLKEKLAEFDCTHRVGYVKPPTVANGSVIGWMTSASRSSSPASGTTRMDCGRLDDVTSTAIMGHGELTTVSQTGKTPSVQETGHSLPYLDAKMNDFHITTSMKEHYL